MVILFHVTLCGINVLIKLNGVFIHLNALEQ